jgi:hypothetical protein
MLTKKVLAAIQNLSQHCQNPYVMNVVAIIAEILCHVSLPDRQ